MSNEEESGRYRAMSDELLEENIAAGPRDGMHKRFAASVAEKDRRRREFEKDLKRPGVIGILTLIAGLVAAVAAAISVGLQLRHEDSRSTPIASPPPASATPTTQSSQPKQSP